MNAAISDLQLHCCCAYTNFYLIILYKISQRLSAAKSFRHKTTDKCEAKSGKRVHSEPRDLMGLPYPLHSYFFLFVFPVPARISSNWLWSDFPCYALSR